MTTIESFFGRYRFLSNFYPCGMDVAGVRYPTLEHAFQAEKTTNMTEREIIRNAKTPGQAKALGRRVTLRENWNEIRVDVMRELLWIKFSDKVLRAELLDTGDAELVEGNTWGDVFWGVCKGRGENMLGKLLMEIRTKIARNRRKVREWQKALS